MKNSFIQSIKNKSKFTKIIIFLLMIIVSGILLNEIINFNSKSHVEEARNFKIVWMSTVLLTAYYWHILFGKNKNDN